MASGVYNNFKGGIMRAEFDCDGDTLTAGLLNNTHAFDADNDAWANVSANEISGTGYTAGGANLANNAATNDDTDDEGVLDADDVAWTSASFSAYHCVIYDNTTTTPVADANICSIDFGGIQTVSSGTFTIQFAAEGIVNIG